MDVAILVSILGVGFLIIICTMGIVNTIREAIAQLGILIDIAHKERTANARSRLGM